MKIISECNKIIVKNIEKFDLATTFNCGQTFRWKNLKNNIYTGCAFGKEIVVYFDSYNNFIIENTSKSEFYSFWKNYFNLHMNYSQINSEILNSPAATISTVLYESITNSPIINILKQDPWETLCSFIISQNNNIPRITKIIEKFSENFGKKLNLFHTFPDYNTVSKLSLKDIEIIKSGFRARYILDAAKKVACKEINLSKINFMDNVSARNYLMKINGVGPKIADCTLLFAYGRLDVFPIDTWIKKVMEKYFKHETPQIFGKYAGIAQQYLFNYARTNLKL